MIGWTGDFLNPCFIGWALGKGGGSELKNMYIHFVFHPYQWNCKGFFPAQRGLRQGNPLSPFLVRNGSEALSQMVEAAGLVNPISPMVLGQPWKHL